MVFLKRCIQESDGQKLLSNAAICTDIVTAIHGPKWASFSNPNCASSTPLAPDSPYAEADDALIPRCTDHGQKSNSSKCRFPCISQKMAAIVFTAQVYIQNQIPYTLSFFLPTTLFTKRSTRFTGESSRLRSVGRVRTVRYRSRLASFGAPNRGCECKRLRDGVQHRGCRKSPCIHRQLECVVRTTLKLAIKPFPACDRLAAARPYRMVHDPFFLSSRLARLSRP